MTVMKIKSKQRVKPAEPTWQGILPLSELDQISVITHSSILYFYDKPTQEEWLINDKIMSTLKESLSRALVTFYPLAGRVSYIGNGRFELDCNGMGADVVEVESSMKIADFGELYFARQKMMRDLLVPMNYYVTPIHELPVMAVQVTRFACGGLSLGVSISHVVADGRSAFVFLKNWARLAVGEPLADDAPFFDRRPLIMLADDEEGEPLQNGAPVIARGPLKLADDGHEGDELLKDDDAPFSDRRNQLMHGDDDHDVLAEGEPLKDDDAPFVDRGGVMVTDEEKPNYFRELRLGEEKWGKLVAPTFVVLTKKMIEGLKDAAKEQGGAQERRPYSRFEVIAAHVWRCACKARELPLEEMTTMKFAVAAYDRMEPPLPSFFGNAVIEVGACSCVGELLSKPLSHGCRIVRKAIQSVTHEYILSSIKFLQQQTSLSQYQYIDDRGIMEGPAYGDNNIVVVSWLNLMYDGLNFGWGTEIQMVPPIIQTCDGDIQLSSYGQDGSVVIDACLQPKEKFVHCVSSNIM